MDDGNNVFFSSIFSQQKKFYQIGTKSCYKGVSVVVVVVVCAKCLSVVQVSMVQENV